MAYQILPQSIMAVSAVGSMNGQETITTVHYRYMDLTGTIPDGRDAIMKILGMARGVDGWFTKYRQCISETVTGIQLFGQWISLARYAYATDGIAVANGLVDGAALPQNVAMVVTRRGDLADRHNISTLHLPGVPSAEVTAGMLSLDQMDAIAAFANATLEPLVLVTGQELQPVAFRRADPAFSRVLTESFAQRSVRVMRRRTVGLGT